MTSIIGFCQKRARPCALSGRTFSTTASGPRRARICATASSAEAAMKGMGWLAAWLISFQARDGAAALNLNARWHFRVGQHGQFGKRRFKEAPESQADLRGAQHHRRLAGA